MTELYSQYLDDLEMTETLKARVDEFYQMYTAICPEEITGILVTDFITDEGLREYESLWFFSDNYTMEAKRFVTEDTFDMATLGNAVVWWEIKKHNYDFAKAGKDSRLHLEFVLCTRITGILKASRENCDHLRDIFTKHVLPNMQRVQPPSAS